MLCQQFGHGHDCVAVTGEGIRLGPFPIENLDFSQHKWQNLEPDSYAGGIFWGTQGYEQDSGVHCRGPPAQFDQRCSSWGVARPAKKGTFQHKISHNLSSRPPMGLGPGLMAGSWGQECVGVER